VLFCQLVDDPSSWPDRFPSEQDQDRERRRLFKIIEELVKWANSQSEVVLDAARIEIARSVARGRIADGMGSPRDDEVLREEVGAESVRLYLSEVAPPVHDPFAGGGSIPLAAQQLGLRVVATDLNPVAVMINKALIELPGKFDGRGPVGPQGEAQEQKGLALKRWSGATGLAEDVCRYTAWVRDRAHERIGHLYPSVTLPDEHGGGTATVIAWLWARTVESPNPAFRGVHVPLVRSFMLATKKDRRAWIEPVLSEDRKTYGFEVRTGSGDPEIAGTVTRNGGVCIATGDPIPFDYIRAEAKAGRMGVRLMAIVAEGKRRRVYLPPSDEMEQIANSAQPTDAPETDLPEKALGFRVQEYGIVKHRHLFTPRQLLAMCTLSDLVSDAADAAAEDARKAGWDDDGRGIEDGGTGATAYGDAIAAYLAICVDRLANYQTTICTWHSGVKYETITSTFARQALPMTWDYAEGNPFSASSGNFEKQANSVAANLRGIPKRSPSAVAMPGDAMGPACYQAGEVICTDPPYYDNIGYADLSDFFYVWMRRSLRARFGQLFDTVLVPKRAELVATPYRHDGKENAEAFFVTGMTNALGEFNRATVADIPVVIYYAFRQSETRDDQTSSTGWETFLQAVIASGFAVVGTWPVRTEYTGNLKKGVNALASSIVLACRKRPADASTVTRGDFRRLLLQELPISLAMLQKGNIAPVDVAQASIGPGMAVFSRYARVMEADGNPMSVRGALQLINQTLDEVFGEEEGEFDRDTRFALTWFESHGFEEGPYGEAETLATARAVSVSGVEAAGVLKSAAGKVRLYSRKELPEFWDPESDERLTVWEGTQHLIKRLNEKGEEAAAELLRGLGATAEQARNLAYRLFTVCDRRGWAEEAQAYNGLVLAWSDLENLASASDAKRVSKPQAELFE
jgi:putative DNA methylase